MLDHGQIIGPRESLALYKSFNTLWLTSYTCETVHDGYKKLAKHSFSNFYLFPQSFANFVREDFTDFEQLYVNLQTQITKLYNYGIGENCVENILFHLIEHNSVQGDPDLESFQSPYFSFAKVHFTTSPQA